MTVQFDHPSAERAATSQYRFEWALASAPTTIIKSQIVAKHLMGVVTDTPLRLWCGVEKPTPLTGPYVIRVVAVNAAGENASAFSAPFAATPPAAPTNVTVHDPQI